MPRVFTAAVLAAALAGLTLAPGASATGTLEIGTAVTPANRTTLTAGTSTLAFSVPTTCPGLAAYVEVATDLQYDSDGSLAASTTVDRFSLEETAPGTYTGTASGVWLQTAAAYYWQLSGFGSCETAYNDMWVGSAFGIIVKAATGTTPTPGVEVPDEIEPLTLAQARAAVPLIIKKARRRIARKLTKSCNRDGAGDINTVTCKASWNDKVQYAYDGTFTLVLDDAGDIVSRFDGRRATLRCLKQARTKARKKKCYRKQRFNVTL